MIPPSAAATFRSYSEDEPAIDAKETISVRKRVQFHSELGLLSKNFRRIQSYDEIRMNQIFKSHLHDTIESPPLSFRQNYAKREFFSDLTTATFHTIDQLLNKDKRPYTSLSLADLEEVNNTYYFFLINEKNTQQKNQKIFNCEEIQQKIQSFENPKLKFIALNLNYYLENVENKEHALLSDENIFKKTLNIIRALLNEDINYFRITDSLSYAHFLIQAFQSLNVNTQSFISYLIFDNPINQLNELICLLKSFSAITPEKIILDREKSKHHKPIKFSLDKDYTFPNEEIFRCFIPHHVILPKCIVINGIPLNLNQYVSHHKENFFNFYTLFLQELNFYKFTEEEIQAIIHTFYNEKSLPENLKNLLGISTTCNVFIAYKNIDLRYPLLRTATMTYRSRNSVKIFYRFDDSEVICTQLLTMTIYPKVSSQGIDKDRPLANFSFILNSHLAANKESRDNVLEFQNLNYIYTDGEMNATPKEKKMIKQAFNEKKSFLSINFKNLLNF